jgi:transcriptional regulator with XRE-family HTH domain
MIATLSPARQKAVLNRAEALISEELSLRELRKKLDLTQTDVARRLKKGQEVVSRIEQREDLLLSTLQGYVESLGGELELVCRFRDRASVRLKPVGTRTANRRNAKRTTRRRSVAL